VFTDILTAPVAPLDINNNKRSRKSSLQNGGISLFESRRIYETTCPQPKRRHHHTKIESQKTCLFFLFASSPLALVLVLSFAIQKVSLLAV
jgi:hypothetical protein